MLKIVRWISGIFLMIHGSVFLLSGISFFRLEDTNLIMPFILTGLITMITGICIVGYNIRQMLRIKKLKMTGLEITGEITEIKKTKIRINHSYDLYKLVVKDRDGNIYFSEMKMQQKFKGYAIGDKVNVLILPDNPKIYTVLLEKRG